MSNAQAHALRYVHEFFFSLNIALAVIWEESLGPFFLELRLQYRINNYLHLHPHSNVGADLATFGLAFALALCIFLFLRLFSWTPLAGPILRSIGGIASLVALPACWLYINYVSWHLRGIALIPGTHGPALSWPLLELGAALACLLLYFSGKWPVPKWGSAALMVMHWSFWGWHFFRRGMFFYPGLVFPLTGLCSSLAWGLYVSRQRAESRLTVPASQ
jgi:hypothetical protein